MHALIRINRRFSLSRRLTLYWVIFSTLFAGCGQAAPSLTKREDVKAFIDDMVSDQNFKRADLKRLFKAVKIKDGILRAISRPAEAKPWYIYRSYFINEAQIEGGVRFWQSNADALIEVEQEYGVPAEIIVAILGVETRYGGNMGSFRVVDALSTLAFEYPKRSEFFLEELKQFLILCREESIDPLKPVGSYAGAMGIPQFMPSSYRNFAKDQDGDGKRDIWKSNRDAIASVANYFIQHGWVKGGLVTVPATVKGNEYQKFLNTGLKPETRLDVIQRSGVQIPDGLDLAQNAQLLQFENEYGPSYWIGMENFYVITRYNHSALYAMAVYQLSQEIVYRRHHSL